MKKEIKISLDWGNLAAVVDGPENGEPVLCLHGWLDNAASFFPMMEWMAKTRRVIALDLPGHGFSDHLPKGCVYHITDTVLHVADAMEKLGIKKYSFVGHSLGGAVAVLLAGTFPDRVLDLVLLDSLGPLIATPAQTAQRLKEYFDSLLALKDKRMPVYKSLEVAVRARLQAGKISSEGAKAIVERGIVACEGGLTWRTDPRLRLPTPRLTETQVEAFLDRIECPVLAFFAKEGLVMKHFPWQERAKHIRQFRYQLVEGDHHFHLDDAKSLEALLLEGASSRQRTT